jgi:hypothetical protein
MRAFVLVAALLLAACSPPGSSPTPTSTALAGSPATSPASSTACIDRGDLADVADVVVNVLQGLAKDLKAPDVVKAKAEAASAATGLRKLADLVSPAQPDAAQVFRSAASEIDSAVPQFPAGQSLVDKAQTDLTSGLTLARAAVCPA